MSYNEDELDKAIKGLKNPWIGFKEDQLYGDGFEDTKIPFFWNEEKVKKDNEGKVKFERENQFPLPINGNFRKAKYLLLYSNPATEKVKIHKKHREMLIDCFQLKDEAILVIPNNNWKSWYQQQLDKFYFNKQEKIDFLTDFCFINLFAYQSATSWFDYNADELRKIHKLETTQFAKDLVKIGIEAGKRILVMRTSENVWKNVKDSENKITFEKLKLEITKIPDDK